MTVRQLASPTRAVVDYLLPLLAPGVSIGVFYPSTATPETPVTPFIQVALDGTFNVRHAEILADSTVRLTVWHTQPDDGETLAWWVLAQLRAYPGSRAAWAILPLTGPLSGRDPDTGLYLTSLTARVSVRPTAA